MKNGNAFWVVLFILASGLIAIKILRIINEHYAKKEFWDCIHKFSGCFQPLAEAVEEKNVNVTKKLLASWEKRSKDWTYLHKYYQSITNIPGSANELVSAERWLEKVEEWGICHEKKGTLFFITPETEAFFFFDDGYEWGDSASVLIPCWYYIKDGVKRCIEKGTAHIMDEQEEEE